MTRSLLSRNPTFFSAGFYRSLPSPGSPGSPGRLHGASSPKRQPEMGLAVPKHISEYIYTVKSSACLAFVSFCFSSKKESD